MDGTTSNNSHGAITPERDRPGALPTGRPRHDNDRRHITGIHVMPTYGEVVSNARPYLPAADPASWHLSGAIGRFDQQFRLLREDNVGQIRDACQEILQAVRNPGLEIYRQQRTTTHFDFCDDAKVQHIAMHKKDGIEFRVACKQPESVRHLTDNERRIWWERCKRFRPGTLVCVLDLAGHILHFVVSESTIRGPRDRADGLAMGGSKFNLSSDRQWSYVNLKLVESSKITDALRWCGGTGWTHYFLDFPNVMLPSFKHTLEALQRDCQSPHRLFRVLDPHSSDTRSRLVVAKPAYARTPGFAFNLDCLMQNGQSFQFDTRHAPTSAQVSSFAGLEPAQATVLLESLSSEVALICGLPRTGKSYLTKKIIKALLHNRENASLGPIVCIFHTDAALDHMVEQLLEDGIDKIVRRGDSPTSERLQSLNLPVTSYMGMCRQERRVEEQMTDLLDKLVSDIQWQLSRSISCASAMEYGLIFGPGRADLSEYQPSRGDHHQMLENSRDYIIHKLRRINDEYEEIRSELPRFHDDARRQILQNAHVVAVTTTEIARCPELFQPIQAKVLVCDNAGEFHGSQILTAILPSTEHIILIGNHTVRSERLQRMNLEGALNPVDFSFFERLVNAAPYHCPRLSGVLSPSPIGESSQPCGRSQPDCTHSCQRTRHGDSECGPCQQPCDVRCSHGRCEKLCSEPCLPCAEDNCASGCPHSKCTMPCAAPCDWIPCSKRCTLLLGCGHQCPSLCGEACPDSMYCQTCGAEDILWTTVIDSSGMKDYRDINLDEDPCIFPHCGHFQTISSMDEQLRIQDFYNLTDDGVPSSIKGVLSPFSMQKVACCTQCRSSLRDICRYGRIIRRPMLDESLEGFLSWWNGKFGDLVDRLTRCVPASNWYMAYQGLPNASFHHRNLLVRLKGNLQEQIHALRDSVGEGRYTELAVLYQDIQNFSRGELRSKEEVFHKVADSMRRANENNKATARSTDTIHLDEPFVLPCGDLIAMDLNLRCNIAVLEDFLRLWRRDSAASTTAFSRPMIQFDMTSNFRASQGFIKHAREANRPMFAAQGHVYFAWYCCFALALRVDASTQGGQSGPAVAGGSQLPVSQDELRTRGEEHLAEADEYYNNCFSMCRSLEDGIKATRDFMRSGNLGSLREPRTLWYTNPTWMFDGTGPWYACDNGHPFMDLRKPFRFLGQLRCMECGSIVVGRKHASDETAPLGADMVVTSQRETLVDI